MTQDAVRELVERALKASGLNWMTQTDREELIRVMTMLLRDYQKA